MTDTFFEKRREYFLRDHYDKTFAKKAAVRTAFIKRLSAFEVHGERQLMLSKERPCLFVANHSAAYVMDVLFMFQMFVDAGLDSNVRGLAHRVAWHPPFSIAPLHKVGAVYAHPEVAGHFVEQGKSLLVFPGGDKEVFRLFKDRYQVDLAERTGFICLAQKYEMPIIPITICGTHAMFLQLMKMPRLSRFMKKYFRASHISLNASQMALIMAGLNPLMWPLIPMLAMKNIVPLPSKVRVDVGRPIKLQSGISDDSAYDIVSKKMQHQLINAAEQRTCPWF